MLRTSLSIQNNRMRGYNSTADMPSPAVYTDTKPATGGSLLVNSINDNCVGCWIFNEGTGTTAHDISASAKHGTLSGGATWDTDDKGTACVSFDGIDGAVTATGFGSVAPTTEMTFLIRQYADFNASQSSFYIVNGSTNINAHCPYSDGTVYWDAGNASSARISYNPGTTTGAWHTWIFIASATGTYSKIYQDGSLGHSGTLTPGFTQGSVDLNIGNHGADSFFTGKIDLLRVWSRALTSGEITTLSSAPYTGIGG